MTSFDAKLAENANKRIEKALADHLGFIEQSRASMVDALAMEKIIKLAQTRISRYINIHKLNERLNTIRDTIAGSDDPEVTDSSRLALMKIAVDAGLPLQRASDLYDLAVREGRQSQEETRLLKRKHEQA